MHRVTYLLPLLLLPALPAAAMRVAPPHACPMIAKLCPDGSSVSPTGPNCEMPACPGGAQPVQPQPMPAPPDGSGSSPGGAPGAVPGSSGDGDSDEGEAGPPTMAPPVVNTDTSPKQSKLPDMPLDAPQTPQPLKFVLEHRSALNGQMMTVHGVVVSTYQADPACVPGPKPCALTDITIADTPDAGRNKAYDVIVNISPRDKTVYAPGQIVDLPVAVLGDRDGVRLNKQ